MQQDDFLGAGVLQGLQGLVDLGQIGHAGRQHDGQSLASSIPEKAQVGQVGRGDLNDVAAQFVAQQIQR